MANCEICKNDYDGRKTKCPYCEDDAAYQRDRIRRRSILEVEAILGTPAPSNSPPITLRTPIVQPTGGASATSTSPARERLDQTLSELGDVSGIVAEFRSLSTALNRRMDGIERLMGEICDRLPVAGNALIQDGGASHQVPRVLQLQVGLQVYLELQLMVGHKQRLVLQLLETA